MLTFTTFDETRVVLAAIAEHQVEPCDRRMILKASSDIANIPPLDQVSLNLQNTARGFASFDEARPMPALLENAMEASRQAHNNTPAND